MQSPFMTQESGPHAEARAADAGSRPRGRSGGAHTVLVAEDDEDVRLLIRTRLDLRGYRVVEARDGQKALELAKDVRPDIVLMDLQLPHLNGFAVARFLRQTDSLRHVPIVVVSAHDPAKHRNLALAAGCNAYVQKPIDFDQLDGLMMSLLS
ncbi:MAG TPA: response regulator [Pyrinomonadaceae bacterium]|jgi:two-component system cell cycle response regulator DivK|nr:response regulator [Pyrinomonadaceae bacterium]